MKLKSKQGSAGLDTIVASVIFILTISIIISFCYSCYRIESRNRTLHNAYETIENRLMELASEDNWEQYHEHRETLSERVEVYYTVQETEFGTLRITGVFTIRTWESSHVSYTYSMERVR